MTVEQVIGAATRAWVGGDAAGGVIAIFDAEGIRRSWCLGLADLESRRGWALDTPTRLASISKHVLSAAVFSLGLDRTLGHYLPELQPALAATTMSRALTMTSGLPDLGESLTLAGLSTTTSMSAERLYAFASRIAHLSFPSGGEVSYSNTNYRLAQHALERQTGRALRGWLHENFFSPLGLASFDLPTDQSEVVPGLAAGYFHVEGKPLRGGYGLHFSGSGGMVASARDLVAWLRALTRGDGPLHGLFARIAIPGVLASGEPVGYSHGFMLHRLGDRDLVGHGGSLPGYKNHFLVDPDSGRGVVVLSNREETEAQSLALAVLAAELGIAHAPQPPDHAPASMFVDPATGHTLELARGPAGVTANFLGTEDRLFLGESGIWRNLAPHMPMRIDPAAPDATILRASIGGAPARLWQRAGGAISAEFVGRYHCAELDARHEISMQGDTLALRYGGGPAPDAACPLRPTAIDCFATTTPFNGFTRQRPVLRFTRDGAGAVNGFTLSSNRSRGWHFARI